MCEKTPASRRSWFDKLTTNGGYNIPNYHERKIDCLFMNGGLSVPYKHEQGTEYPFMNGG